MGKPDPKYKKIVNVTISIYLQISFRTKLESQLEMLTFFYFLKNERFVMKTTTKIRKMIVFKKLVFKKTVVIKTMVFIKHVVSLTIVNRDPSLSIVKYNPFFNERGGA